MEEKPRVKILGLMGSPKKKGNADLLLDRAIQGAESAAAQGEKVLVSELKIAPCLACGDCERTGECVVHDDMQEVYPKLREADGIIVSTPVFFMGLPAQLKALVDRCQPFWTRKYLLAAAVSKKRAGLLIAVGGTNLPHTFDAIRLEVKSFFHCLEVKYSGELLFPGVEEAGEIANHPEALSRAYQAGRELARSLKSAEK